MHSGATFGGSGSLGSSLTVESGAFLAPGGVSPGSIEGVLTVGSLNLNAGSSTAMQIAGNGSGSGVAGTGYDSIVVSGSDGLSYGGELSLMFSNASDFVLGTTFNLFSHSGSAAGALEHVTAGGSGNYAGLSFSSDGNGNWYSNDTASHQYLKFSLSTGNLVVVPEPSTWAMAIVGLIIAGWRGRRRTKAKRCQRGKNSRRWSARNVEGAAHRLCPFVPAARPFAPAAAHSSLIEHRWSHFQSGALWQRKQTIRSLLGGYLCRLATTGNRDS